MTEAQTKDRLIEEMRENDRLRARVAELEGALREAAQSLRTLSVAMIEVVRLRARVAELENEASKWERAARRLAEFADDAEGQTGEQFTPDEWIVYAMALESDRDRYKRAAESLAAVLGEYSLRIARRETIETDTLRTAEAWLRWAMESPPEQQAQKEDVCEFCGDKNCTFQNPRCAQHQERISMAMAHGMPRSGRHG